MSHEKRLSELGLELPPAPQPVATYSPTVQTGNLLYLSGQIARGPRKGHVGNELTVDEGREAARACGLSLLAQARAALGSLDRVVRVIKLTGWVASTDDFTEQPEVMNGASDLMVEVFGEAGRHSRAAVSAPALPRGAAVEVEAIFEVQ